MFVRCGLKQLMHILPYSHSNQTLPHPMKTCRNLLLLMAFTLPLAGSAAKDLYWDESSTNLPAWVRNQVIYEVNVRQYSEAGTFAAVEADLDRLVELGVGTLWFMPIHPIGEVNRKGELGSYYSIRDYKAVNPEFGTKEAFRSLVEAAHARGLKVILDWVGNHTAWDHVWVESHPDFYARNAAGEMMPPPEFPDWSDVAQINFDNPEVLQAHLDAMRYWVVEFGVDGYRCDYATGVPTEFWNNLCRALLETRPDLFLLAEAEVPDHQLEAFHASYGWPVMHAFNGIAQGEHPASYIDDVRTRMGLEFPGGSDFLYMTSNHDENSWEGTVQQRLGGGAEVFAVLSFVLDGIPLIYNGQEAGLNKRLEFFERDPIEWREHPFFKLYQILSRLKSTHSALLTGAGEKRLPSTQDEEIFALMRHSEQGRILFYGNLTARDIDEAYIVSPSLRGTWTNAMTGETVHLGTEATVELNSWEYVLLVQGE